MNKIIEKADQAYLATYKRVQVAFDHGEGMYLYDTEGKEYLDFGAGIAVMGLGYHHPKYTAILEDQVNRLIHTSNLFYHEPGARAAAAVTKATGMDRVFFTNSGAEAMEGALKLAKKYANKAGKGPDHQIIAFEDSFHGRTIGAVSVTGHTEYRTPFEPLMPGVVFARYNDLESVKALMSEKTACVILETVQGEGGVHPASEEFLTGIRALCDQYDALLILDEVQCGMGRCGTMFAYEAYGVKPDIVTCAKALGCGVPVGCFAATEKAATMGYGDHGSTYGGNPLVCAAVAGVFSIFEEEHILENVQRMSLVMDQALGRLAGKFSVIRECRGRGLLRGIEFMPGLSSAAVAMSAVDHGLISIGAANNTLRLMPPLIVTEKDIARMEEILGQVLSEMTGGSADGGR